MPQSISVRLKTLSFFVGEMSRSGEYFPKKFEFDQFFLEATETKNIRRNDWLIGKQHSCYPMSIKINPSKIKGFWVLVISEKISNKVTSTLELCSLISISGYRISRPFLDLQPSRAKCLERTMSHAKSNLYTRWFHFNLVLLRRRGFALWEPSCIT
jgi:hypothetical protein